MSADSNGPATRDSWKTEPIGSTAAVNYEATFTSAEHDRIRRGLIPRAMEDKWFAFAEDDTLYFYRSWTGRFQYAVTFEQVEDGARVTHTEAESDAHQPDEYDARLLDFLIRSLLLGGSTPFPVPPEVRPAKAEVFQHHVAGTGYPMESAGRGPGSFLARIRHWLKRD